MKIAHLCLSCFYIDGGAYQENELVAQHIDDGHDVIVITSTENHDIKGELCYVNPSTYLGKDGALVHRLAYHSLLPEKIARKLRIHNNVYNYLTKFKPDVVLFHGLSSWELLTSANYKKANPRVKLYADNHADWNNSARGFFSREILHKIYYKCIVQLALPAIEKILCISTETMDFVEQVYKVDQSELEFFPLGGHPLPDKKYLTVRESSRKNLGINDELVFLQSGKQTKRKKLIESLKAFSSNSNPNFRFFIAGSLFDDIKDEAESLIAQDERISFLGWQSSKDLNKLLCATDVYLQPGTQSVTMQHSLCTHCAVILDNVPAHQPYFKNNGWLINKNCTLVSIFDEINLDNNQINEMGQQSFLIASEMLDYSKLSQRILV